MTPLLEVRHLSKVYISHKKEIRSVDDVSFSIQKGEILGLVGESGSGKSTLAKMLIRLITPTSGKILFEGKEIERGRGFCKKIQMIFQDPFASLNPRMTVEKILQEPFQIHKLPKKVDMLLDLVGLPRQAKARYPHEFSGGQRQRIGIARALALQPDFLICDEPVSALDVSIQSQIVKLLLDLQKELSLTYLFIAHDLAMIRHVAKRVAVMYQGRFVEEAPTEELYRHPQHPYTQLLLSSVPQFQFEEGLFQFEESLVKKSEEALVLFSQKE